MPKQKLSATSKVATATVIAVEIVRKSPDQVGFAVQPRRWVVERFFAWINRNRRLAKDFEATIAAARAFLYAASVMLLSADWPEPHDFRNRLLIIAPDPMLAVFAARAHPNHQDESDKEEQQDRGDADALARGEVGRQRDKEWREEGCRFAGQCVDAERFGHPRFHRPAARAWFAMPPEAIRPLRR